ncbi:hypothetical protein HMF3257_20240 [Spirosoma telluris]|uniref:Uncharacterized protein n=2 Tax=Spirosoma telluris TaxID=2183553 RepID=A0A327NM87_9BACT|nr:hypothetical protein HMF3257_20240 [Spirosoma telluris]
MLLYAYRTIINLTTYALLALTWERSLRKPALNQLPEECLELIKNTLFTANSSDKKLSNLDLLKKLGLFLTADQQDKFISQFAILISELDENEYRWALDDLESKVKNQEHYRAYFPASPDPDAFTFCLETEHSLAIIMILFGFWVNYSLTSIKDIGFLKFHRLKERTYLHRIVQLQYGHVSVKPDDDQFSIPTPLETTSIILHLHDKWSSGGLNLSPFLIDRNALIRAPKADLHYLLSFSTQGKGAFCYRKLNSYEGTWDIPSKEKPKSVLPTKEAKEEAIYHALLKKQITAFAQTVLNKSLDEL